MAEVKEILSLIDRSVSLVMAPTSSIIVYMGKYNLLYRELGSLIILVTQTTVRRLLGPTVNENITHSLFRLIYI